MLEAIFIVISASLLTSIILVMSFKKLLPNILEDVAVSAGEQITEKINETLTSPQISKAMSILGKKSGEARADKALRNKAANKLLEGVPSIGFILDQLDLTPVEGLQLMNDPLVGPFIKNLISGGLGGLKGLVQSRTPSAGSSSKDLFKVT